MEPTDPDLVASARDGDRTAFAQLVVRHRTLLLVLCRRMLGDGALAEDAAQEAILAAWLGLDTLRQPDRFGPWLAGIGLNICRNALRTRLWWQPLDQQVPSTGADPHEAAEAAELAAAVHRAIAALPPGQRAAATLFYLRGLSHRELADALGIRIGAVKTRLYKARATLRTRLAHHWEEKPVPIPMRVAGVHRLPEDRFVVLLEEVDGDRRLPIWIGPSEAVWLASGLEAVDWPRPGPYHLSARLLELSGAAVRNVRISRLEAFTFYAAIELTGPRGAVTIDARPSDALNLALQVDAPITVDPAVLAALNEHSIPGMSLDDALADSQADAAEIIREVQERQEAFMRALREDQ